VVSSVDQVLVQEAHRHFFATCQLSSLASVGDFGFVLGSRAVAALHRLLTRQRCFRMPTKSLPSKFPHRHYAWSAITFQPASVCSSVPWQSAQVPFNLAPTSDEARDAHFGVDPMRPPW